MNLRHGATSSGSHGQDAGAGILVGITAVMGDDVRLPESSLRNHWFVLGRSGVGKSTLIKQLLAHRLARKAAGHDDGAVVVVDTHGGLVPGLRELIPSQLEDRVRLLDFGRRGGVEGFNLVDPNLFPDQHRSVETFVNTCRRLWEIPDGRWEDLLRHSLWLLHEFNKRHAGSPNEMLDVLCLPSLLEWPNQNSQGADITGQTQISLERVLSDVDVPRLQAWFHNFRCWDPEVRLKTAAFIQTRIGGYSSNQRTAAILGLGESTVTLSDVLDKGLVVLVSVDAGSIGAEPAALLGGSIVSVMESVLRERGLQSEHKAADCLLVCDEIQAVPGPDWEFLLSDARKYGCSLMLSARSLAGDGVHEQGLCSAVLRTVGCMVGFQMAAEDARIIAPEMADDRVEERYLASLDPFHCYLRLDADGRRYPVRPMKILPPPESVLGMDAAGPATLGPSVD